MLHLVPTHDMRLYRNVHQIFSSYQWKQRRICCSLATDTEVSTATPPHYRAASLLRLFSRFRGFFFICQDLKFFQWHQACQANFVACVGFKYFPLSLTLLKEVDQGKVSVKKCWVWQRSITRTHTAVALLESHGSRHYITIVVTLKTLPLMAPPSATMFLRLHVAYLSYL